MRSELVFRAMGPMPGRYRLCRLTARASRKLHTPRSRIQDTLNDVLLFLANSKATMSDQQIGAEKSRRDLARASILRMQQVAQIGHRSPHFGLPNAPGSLPSNTRDRKINVFESPSQTLLEARDGVEKYA